MVVYVVSSYVVGSEHDVHSVHRDAQEAVSAVGRMYPEAALVSEHICMNADEVARYVLGMRVIIIHISTMR